MIIINEILVNKGFEDVWSFLEEPQNTAKWQEGFVNWSLLEGEKGKPGSRAEWAYNTGTSHVKVVETINEIEKGKYTGTFRHDALTIVMRLVAEAFGEKTHLKTSLELQFTSPSMDVTAPFMRKIFNSRQEKDLQNLKTVLEQPAS